jgi:hypothetical protein
MLGLRIDASAPCEARSRQPVNFGSSVGVSSGKDPAQGYGQLLGGDPSRAREGVGMQVRCR